MFLLLPKDQTFIFYSILLKGETFVVARIFVQFGPKVRFHICILCSSDGVAAYCEIAAYSAYDMFNFLSIRT